MKRRYHPGDVAVRVLGAVVGGYLLTLMSARAMASVLPLDGAEAAIAASLGAWIIFLGVAIWSFAARTPVLAVVPSIIVGALLFAVTS